MGLNMNLLSRTLLNGAIWAIALAGPATSQSLNGATAHDGDDIILNGTDFRLQAIDALEKDQTCEDRTGAAVPCGRIAKAELDAILKGKQVECKPSGQRDGNRVIGQCFASGVSVEHEIVRRGWAFVRPDFAKERTAELCQIERTAAASSLGAWALKFERPYFFKGGKKKTLQQIACQHEYTR
jgi:endonuclease YncB( thermonuclease family)